MKSGYHSRETIGNRQHGGYSVRLDWDQIREILKEVEALGGQNTRLTIGRSPNEWRAINVALGRNPESNLELCDTVYFYHARLLVKEHFVEGKVPYGHVKDDAYRLTGLTLAGHELLEKIRDDGVWRQITKWLDLNGPSVWGLGVKTAIEAAIKENLPQ